MYKIESLKMEHLMHAKIEEEDCGKLWLAVTFEIYQKKKNGIWIEDKYVVQKMY